MKSLPSEAVSCSAPMSDKLVETVLRHEDTKTRSSTKRSWLSTMGLSADFVDL